MSTAVAHEINNPLETIQNLLYLIRSTEGIPASAVDLARTAAEEADRVVTISRSTLSFFRQTAAPEAAISSSEMARPTEFISGYIPGQSGLERDVFRPNRTIGIAPTRCCLIHPVGWTEASRHGATVFVGPEKPFDRGRAKRHVGAGRGRPLRRWCGDRSSLGATVP